MFHPPAQKGISADVSLYVSSFCEMMGCSPVVCHMSKEQRDPGCLVYVEDEIRPSYVKIIIHHYKDAY